MQLSTFSNSPYIDRKQIKDALDSRVKQEGSLLLVPCLDIEGVIWGAQKINQAGGKFFEGGQKKKETFFNFGNLAGNRFYFCEGFATGASLFLALQKPVITCWDAGNLKSVLIVFRKKFPQAEFTICGDDDKFKDKNPGRQKAEEAARVVNASVVFPTFKNSDSKPTDFNDLHCLEGLKEVENQVMSAIKTHHYDIAHLETEKLPCNTIALKILEKHNIITDKHNNTYEFNGAIWEARTETQLKTLASTYDAIEHTSTKRKSEIVGFLKNRSIPAIPWRNIEDDQIPFRNGLYSLSLETLLPIRDDHWLETTLPLDFNPDADCPTWRQCLEDWFEGDEDCESKKLVLQQFFAYVLMPHTLFKKALMLFGKPHSGKSKILDTLRLLVGSGNHCEIPVEHMDEPKKLAPIKGKMVNLIDELSNNALLADGGFKKLVSGASVQIDAKFLNQEFYTPFCKHVIATNNWPKINDASDATYNRILLLTFNKKIEAENDDKFLMQKIEAELPGIARWAIDGAASLLEEGGEFCPIAATEETFAEHKVENNAAWMFAEECFIESSGSKVPTDKVYARFMEWDPRSNMGRTTLTQQLRKAGYDIGRVAQPNGLYCGMPYVRCLYGYRLRLKGEE